MGLLDWALTDPTQAGGGLLAQWLGLNKSNPGLTTSTPTTPTTPLPGSGYGPFGVGGGGPLLGNSPLIQGLRGGLTGLAGSTGYSGAGALGAGFVSAEDQAQKRRQWDLQNRLSGLDLYRQQMLLNGMPYSIVAGMNGGRGGPGSPPEPISTGSGNTSSASAPLDPTAQGGQSESTFMMGPNGYGSSQLPAPPAQGTPQSQPQPGPATGAPAGYGGLLSGQGGGNGAAGGTDAAFKAATGYDSPAAMFRYGQWRMYAGDAKGGETLMIQALQYDPGLQAQAALLKSRNTITEGRAGSQPLLNGQPLGRGVPQIQQLTDPRSGQKYFAHVYPNGDIEPLRMGGNGAPGSTGGGQAIGGGNGGGVGAGPGAGPGNGGGALPPALWTAQQYVESHFNPKAISPVGATGPAQFMPDTAKQYGGNGTQAQQAYMADLYRQYGSMPVALAAYNWGPKNVDMWLKGGADPQKLPAETQAYISKVLDLTGKAGGFGNGNISGAFNPGGNGGSQFASSANVGSNPGAGLVVSDLGPEQSAALTARGGELENTLGKQIDDEARGAVQQNSLIGQMRIASDSFSMGPMQPRIGQIQSYFQQMFPDSKELATAVGGWQDFKKLGGQLVRQAVKDTSSRAAAQEFNMIASALPSDVMSRPGFGLVADQMAGLNDWKIARQQAAQAWRQQPGNGGTIEGFDSTWNRNVSPSAFWIMRMPENDLKVVYATLSKTKEGQATAARLAGELSYLKANGLDQYGGN
jgi:hypothetical protein